MKTAENRWKKQRLMLSAFLCPLAVCTLFCCGVSRACLQNVFCFPCGCSHLRKERFTTKADHRHHHFCAGADRGGHHGPLRKVSWKLERSAPDLSLRVSHTSRPTYKNALKNTLIYHLAHPTLENRLLVTPTLILFIQSSEHKPMSPQKYK